MKEKYDLSFEEAQDLESKTGLDVYANDGDIFINRDNITRTIGNVLQFGIDYQKELDDEEMGKALLYAVHKTTERTKKEMIDKSCELLCKTCNIGVCGEDQKCHRYKGFRKELED